MWKKENSLFSLYDPLGVKLLTRLRFQFSHLEGHKCRHGFGDKINAMYTWGSEVETNGYFFLRCLLYSSQRLELFDNLEKVDSSCLNLNVKDEVSFPLYCSQSATSKSFNHDIFKITINYIKELVFLIEHLFVQTIDFLCFIIVLSFLNNFSMYLSISIKDLWQGFYFPEQIFVRNP